MSESEDRRLSVALFRQTAAVPLLQADYSSGSTEPLRNQVAPGHCDNIRFSKAIIGPSTISRWKRLPRADGLEGLRDAIGRCGHPQPRHVCPSKVSISNRRRLICATRPHRAATASSGAASPPDAMRRPLNLIRPRQIATRTHAHCERYRVPGPAQEFDRRCPARGYHVFVFCQPLRPAASAVLWPLTPITGAQ